MNTPSSRDLQRYRANWRPRFETPPRLTPGSGLLYLRQR